MRYFTSLFLLCFLLIFLPSQAQIIIANQDMPVSGDTLRYSNANTITQLNLGNTGANTSWDYSNLTMVTQGVATYKKASQVNGTYGLFFGFGAYGLRVIDSIGAGQIQIKNIYDFYNKSQNEFTAKGRGLEALNFPIPSFYGDPDEIYQFPLTFGRVDTSTYQVTFSLLTLGSFTQTGMRVNTVDGWGTIITPYDTFKVLRIKSEIFEQDSLGSDQLPQGLKFANNQVQYKWLAKNQHLPILEVDGNVIGGTFIQTAVKYRDIFHVSPLAPTVDFTANSVLGTTRDTFRLTNRSNGIGNAYNWSITPNSFSYTGGSTATSTNPSVRFHNAGWYTVKLDATNFAGNGTLTKTSYIYVGYPDGIDEQTITPNSFIGVNAGNHIIYSYDLKQNASVSLSLYNMEGRLQQTTRTENQAAGKQIGQMDISSIPSGIYLLVLEVNGASTTLKIVKE